MVEASCHCGAVVLELAEPPAHVFDGLSKASAQLHHLDGASTGAFWT